VTEQTTAIVPEDPSNPGSDVLRGELGTRTHYIHIALAEATRPLTVQELGERAEVLARAGGYDCKPTTFAPQTTRSHLVSMRDKPGRGFAEQVPDGRWQLTNRAKQLLSDPSAATPKKPASHGIPDGFQAVDERGWLQLPKAFAGATVQVEATNDTELRIRKAVVIPASALPLMEDHLKPLSDRDRDLFLGLLDNPPKPTAAFRAAAKKYNESHE
jgi:hypothetical protein